MGETEMKRVSLEGRHEAERIYQTQLVYYAEDAVFGSRTLHSACSFSGQETRDERADHQRSTEYEAEVIRKRREWPLLAADPAWRRLSSCFLSIQNLNRIAKIIQYGK
jgi:hypothetical protein